MAATLRQLAELVHGNLVGDGNLVIQSARILKDAQPGDITFVENAKNASQLDQCQASAAIVPNDLAFPGKTLIRVADPLMAFAAVFQHFKGTTEPAPVGIDPRAVIHPTAVIGADASIGPFTCIGAGAVIGNRCRIQNAVNVAENCRIGDDVVLHANVVIYADTVLGDCVIIHANSVIGADGFGYRFQKGRHVKVPQLSNVIIGSDVEIGACTCIDRGAFEPTTIGDGTKIDNLVQIAHAVQIGKHNAIAAQVGIAGSASTGNYVFMGGQSGVSDHVKIGEGSMIGAKTGVFQDVGPGQRKWLFPAHDELQALRIVACLKKLPNMRDDLLRVLKVLNLTDSASTSAARKSEASAA